MKGKRAAECLGVILLCLLLAVSRDGAELAAAGKMAAPTESPEPTVTAAPTPTPVPSPTPTPIPTPTPTPSPADLAPELPDCEAVNLWVDGEAVDYAYRGEGGCFVDPASLLSALDCPTETVWDEAGTLEISASETFLLRAEAGEDYLTLNGRFLYNPQGCLRCGDRAFFPLDVVGQMFSLSLEEGETEEPRFSTDSLQILQGGEHYYELHYPGDDLYWLSHLIEAEAGNQPLDCRIGVGNVVLHRRASEHYPDTVFDVVFDYQNAPQFSVVGSPAMSLPISPRTWAAACLSIEGCETAPGCLFFQNPLGITPNWMSTTRTYVMTLGDMDYYS